MRNPGNKTQTSRARMRPPVVLIADDFEDNNEMYSEYLEHVGFRVIAVRDGQAAIDEARAKKPAVIVMDLSLPRVDGWEATRILKSDPETAGICILVLSGHAEPASRARALAAGCDVFMAKPCLPSDLGDQIKKCLEAVNAPPKTRGIRRDRR
jgi:two-component system cell cycle response regulator DivK